MLLGLVLSPVVGYAQTEEEFRLDLLQRLVALMTQLMELQAQLAILQAEEAERETKVDQIVEDVEEIKVNTTRNLGSVEPTPEPIKYTVTTHYGPDSNVRVADLINTLKVPFFVQVVGYWPDDEVDVVVKNTKTGTVINESSSDVQDSCIINPGATCSIYISYNLPLEGMADFDSFTIEVTINGEKKENHAYVQPARKRTDDPTNPTRYIGGQGIIEGHFTR